MNIRIKRIACALAHAAVAGGIGAASAADIKDRNFKVAMANAAGTAQYDGAARFAELLDKKSGGKKNADALEALKTRLTVIMMAPAELAKMQDKSKPVIEKFTKTFGEPFVNEMYAEIAKARGGK